MIYLKYDVFFKFVKNGGRNHYKGSCQWNDNSMTIAAHIALKLSFIDMYIVNKRIIIKL